MNFSKDVTYIGLVTNDIATGATIFGEHLGLARTDCQAGLGDEVPVSDPDAAAEIATKAGIPAFHYVQRS